MSDVVRRFKRGLSLLNKHDRFLGWSESNSFAGELEQMLGDLSEADIAPEQGVQLILAFFETDKSILGHADDSDGSIGDVYREIASGLFARYAGACQDREPIAAAVLALYRDDDYGVRDAVLDRAAEFLPEHLLRGVVDRLWEHANQLTKEYEKRHCYYGIESLARQLKDPQLFEKARRLSWGKLGTAAFIDIARAYLDAGEPGTALTWLNRVPRNDTFEQEKRDSTLLEVHRALGQKEEMASVAWRIFRRSRSPYTFEPLIAIVGEDRREGLLREESELILTEKDLEYGDVAFLLWAEAPDKAEGYLLARASQLNGDDYYAIKPLAEAFEELARMLSASVLYRSLLDSILRRGISKYYSHGVRYLQKLDKIAPQVQDWGEFPDHATYRVELTLRHKRKSAFWAKLESPKKRTERFCWPTRDGSR